MRYWAGFGCLILLAVNAFAADTIASASSKENFVLRGAEVTVAGVPSWPVFNGDEIAAGKADVALKFSCGSRILLHPDSDAHVVLEGSNVTVHLARGRVSYKRSKGCALALIGPDGAPVAAQGIGTATLVGTAIVVGTVATGVAVYGVSQGGGNAPNNPPSVSPSN